MNKEQKIIVDTLGKYPDALKSRKRFIGMLSDCIHEDNALKNALISAYDEDVLNILIHENDLQRAIYLCKKKLENNYGLISDVAMNAITIMVYLCGRQEEVPEVPEDFSRRREDGNQSEYREEYKHGYIEFVYGNDGIIITNAEFGQNLQKTKTTIVFPEKIRGYKIIGVKKDAFNKIRKSRYKRILLPYSVKFIGEENDKLYENFKEKGVFAKPIIYVAPKSYVEYKRLKSFFNELMNNLSEDYFGFEIDQDSMDKSSFVPIRLNENDCWNYPDNGIWISGNNCLIAYTGIEDEVCVCDCKSVAENAFENSSVKVIRFESEITMFSSGMIHDCEELRKVVFCASERCYFSPGAIYGCKELSEVIWPKIFNYEQNSLYYNCCKLGNMIFNNRLLTCQENGNVIKVNKEVTHINNQAFISCYNASIVIIPSNVVVVEDKAFDQSKVNIVIFDGLYTRWKVQTHDDTSLYVFCRKDSNVMRSLSPFEEHPNIYMKNINSIEGVLGFREDEIIEKIISNKLNKTSDEEMILKPYYW